MMENHYPGLSRILYQGSRWDMCLFLSFFNKYKEVDIAYSDQEGDGSQ